jgi:hypothetical protein
MGSAAVSLLCGGLKTAIHISAIAASPEALIPAVAKLIQRV